MLARSMRKIAWCYYERILNELEEDCEGTDIFWEIDESPYIQRPEHEQHFLEGVHFATQLIIALSKKKHIKSLNLYGCPDEICRAAFAAVQHQEGLTEIHVGKFSENYSEPDVEYSHATCISLATLIHEHACIQIVGIDARTPTSSHKVLGDALALKMSKLKDFRLWKVTLFETSFLHRIANSMRESSTIKRL